MKRGKHVGEKATTDAVKARSGGDCEVRIFGVCLGRATNRHHRKNRSQGGGWDATQILHVCGSGSTGCHGALTNTNGRRQEFVDAGWIVPSYGDPAATEVLLWREGRQDWWLLLPDGTVELAPWPEGKSGHPDELGTRMADPGLDGVA